MGNGTLVISSRRETESITIAASTAMEVPIAVAGFGFGAAALALADILAAGSSSELSLRAVWQHKRSTTLVFFHTLLDTGRYGESKERAERCLPQMPPSEHSDPG